MPVGQLAPAGRFRESSRKGQGIEGLPRGQLAPVIQRAAPHGLELAAPRRQRRAERAVHPKLLGRDLLLAEDRRLRVALAARSDLSTSGRSVRRREVSAGVRSAGVGPVAGVLSLDLVSTSARSRLDLGSISHQPRQQLLRLAHTDEQVAADAAQLLAQVEDGLVQELGAEGARLVAAARRAPVLPRVKQKDRKHLRVASWAGRGLLRRGAAWRARAVDVPWRSRSSRAKSVRQMVHPRGLRNASTWKLSKRLGSDVPPPRPCARGCGRGKGCRGGGGRCAPTCAQRGGRWPQEESCARSAHSAAAVCLGRCHRGQGRERMRTRQSASAWLRPVHRALGGGQEASSSRLGVAWRWAKSVSRSTGTSRKFP